MRFPTWRQSVPPHSLAHSLLLLLSISFSTVKQSGRDRSEVHITGFAFRLPHRHGSHGRQSGRQAGRQAGRQGKAGGMPSRCRLFCWRRARLCRFIGRWTLFLPGSSLRATGPSLFVTPGWSLTRLVVGGHRGEIRPEGARGGGWSGKTRQESAFGDEGKSCRGG